MVPTAVSLDGQAVALQPGPEVTVDDPAERVRIPTHPGEP